MRIFLLIFWLPVCAAFAGQNVDVGRFSSGNTDGWAQKSFIGYTQYRIDDQQRPPVLDAISQGTASALYRKIKVDLTRTPVLHWRWRKIAGLGPVDENTRGGDDYVARIYVIKDGGLLFWKTRAVNYVWSQQHQKGEVWDNPFAGSKAKMTSQRDAEDQTGTWYDEQRNVVQDFKQILGMDVEQIDGIAIMTDSDNSGGQAHAQFGDIYFSAE